MKYINAIYSLKHGKSACVDNIQWYRTNKIICRWRNDRYTPRIYEKLVSGQTYGQHR